MLQRYFCMLAARNVRDKSSASVHPTIASVGKEHEEGTELLGCLTDGVGPATSSAASSVSTLPSPDTWSASSGPDDPCHSQSERSVLSPGHAQATQPQGKGGPSTPQIPDIRPTGGIADDKAPPLIAKAHSMRVVSRHGSKVSFGGSSFFTSSLDGQHASETDAGAAAASVQAGHGPSSAREFTRRRKRPVSAKNAYVAAATLASKRGQRRMHGEVLLAPRAMAMAEMSRAAQKEGK